MQKVAHITKLSGKLIKGFSGKSYADSILLAEKFAKYEKVTLHSYYEQEHRHKSILVGYDK
jgi:hypothetical protein